MAEDSSIISDVLDFVSREIHQFVVAAAGGTVTLPLAPCPAPITSKHPPPPNAPSHLSPISREQDRKHDPDLRPSNRKYAMPGALYPRSPTIEPNDFSNIGPWVDSIQGQGPCSPRQRESDAGLICHQSNNHRNHHTLTQYNNGLTVKSIVRQPHVGIDKAIPTLQRCVTQAPAVDANRSNESIQREISNDRMKHKEKQRELSDLPLLPLEVVSNQPTVAKSPQELPAVQISIASNSSASVARESVEEKVRDKERIRLLEEEVSRLRQELSKREMGTLTTSLSPPPPPPPPPPPIPDRASKPDTLFASARAALRRAPVPIEAPINSNLSTKRKGLPTVGVPADKMAAFLKEMKNVRLRKVARAPDHQANLSWRPQNRSSLQDASGVSSATFDVSYTSNPRFYPTGVKRKRVEDIYPSSKHPSLDSRSDMTCSTMPCIEVNHVHGCQSQPSAATIDLTPSLCSDNDIERDEVTPDHIPRTPPRSSIGQRICHTPSGIKKPEYIDVDSYIPPISDTDPRMRNSNSVCTSSTQLDDTRSFSFDMEDIFSKRIPLSPLPSSSTPRKPRPPSRKSSSPSKSSSRFKVEPKRSSMLTSVVTDEAKRTNRSEYLGKGRKTVDKSKSQNNNSGSRNCRTGSNSHLNSNLLQSYHTTSRTLDEELQHAVNSLKSIGQNPVHNDEEYDIFLGFGSREPGRGFLAHGGAGGLPVWTDNPQISSRSQLPDR
ncbi:hypothetical protein AMATHDRAFT_1617 [Amanita thiersii Skay4041]|uniref:Uncharacterized protein n=1 Tax=Amanita thiersii Skay4041 TaxID=703135 RepID=A0A2A9NZ79_9AGAR|nr:hypothetical protein AMATHDRAFT_1617 [Amanita thiersii Skay4041]